MTWYFRYMISADQHEKLIVLNIWHFSPKFWRQQNNKHAASNLTISRHSFAKAGRVEGLTPYDCKTALIEKSYNGHVRFHLVVGPKPEETKNDTYLWWWHFHTCNIKYIRGICLLNCGAVASCANVLNITITQRLLPQTQLHWSADNILNMNCANIWIY